MAIIVRLRAYQGDSYLSPLYAVVIGGEGIDLNVGWTVKAQAKNGSALVVDWGVTVGTSIIIEELDVNIGTEADPVLVTTTGFRLYVNRDASTLLPIGSNYACDAEINHPTFGPLSDPYRVTLLAGTFGVYRDTTE